MVMSGRPSDISEHGRALADAVRTYRERRGMTYTDLSRTLGRDINPVGIRRIENYERRVDIDDLYALAAALEVTPAVLLGETASPRITAASARKLRDAAQKVLDQLGGKE